MDTVHQTGSQGKDSFREQGKKFARDLVALGYCLVPLRGKDAYDAGWPTNEYPISELEARIDRGDNIGIIFGQDLGDGTRLIGLDVDFEAQPLSALIWKHLPKGTFRIGNPFKFLMPLRVRDEEAGSRDHSFYNGPVLGAERCAIQVLGRGQKAPAGPKQAAGFGIHPKTKTPYQWYPDAAGRRIWEVGPGEAPYVADLAGLLDTIAGALEPKGWTRKAPRNPDAAGTGEAFGGPFSKAMIDDALALLESELGILEGMAAGAGRGTRAFELGLQIGAVVRAGHVDLDQTLDRLRAAMPDNDNALREFTRGVEASEGQRQKAIHDRENPDWEAAAKAQGINWEDVIRGAADDAEDFRSEERTAEHNAALARTAIDMAAKATKRGDQPGLFEALKLLASLLAAGMSTTAELVSWWSAAADRDKLVERPELREREAKTRAMLTGLQAGDPAWAQWACKFMAGGADPETAIKRASTMRGQGAGAAGASGGAGQGPGEPDDDAPVAWDVDGDGVALPGTYSNFAFFLCSQLRLRAELDTFTRRVGFRRLSGPAIVDDAELEVWNASTEDACAAIYSLATDSRMLAWAPAAYAPKLADIRVWLGRMAKTRSFNSLVDRLDHWEAWDGQERVASWFGRYMGYAPGDAAYDYVCAAGAHFLRNWVARMMRPGHKFDEILSAIGLEGERKTTLFETLANAVAPSSYLGGQKFQFDSSTGINRVADATAGKTLVELAELKRLIRMDPEAFKALVSGTSDSGRRTHGADSFEQRRQFSFVGTANVTPLGCSPEDVRMRLLAAEPWARDAVKREVMQAVDAGFLVDGTGSRRFLPVMVMKYKMDLEGLQAEAPQLIAEAKAQAVAAGFVLHMDDQLERLAAAAVRVFKETDGVEEALRAALEPVAGVAHWKASAAELKRLVGLQPMAKRTAFRDACEKAGLSARHTMHGGFYFVGDWDIAERIRLVGGPGAPSIAPMNPPDGAGGFTPG